MIANNTSKIVFTIFALICTHAAQANANAQANLIFRNPNASANANVITDISNLVSPDTINAIRTAVINSVQQNAGAAVNTAQNTANAVIDGAQNAANNAVDTTQAAAGNLANTAEQAINNAPNTVGAAVNTVSQLIPIPNPNANIAANVNSRRLQATAGLGGLGGLLSLPLSLLNLPLGLVSGILGSN